MQSIIQVQILSATKGNIKATLNVEKEHLNMHGVIHTGLLATLTDQMTMLALVNQIQKVIPVVSLDIHLR